MTDQKIVVLGIDGATFDIIRPLAQKGRLPNFKRLMEEGVQSVLNSTVPPVSPVAWTSFMTGTAPLKHRIFDFSGKVAGDYRFTINTAHDRQMQPLWTIASEAGKRVLVVGVTMTYPPDVVNGCMVSGLGAPPNEDIRKLSYPPEFGQEIEATCGPYRMVPEADLRILHRSDKEKKKYIDGIFKQIDDRVALFRHAWRKEQFDFSMLFFLDTDGISHYFWRYMDSGHRQHQQNEFGDAIFRIYEKIDAALGELITILDGQAGLVLVSDHGFGPMNRVLFLNNWLESRGYLVYRKQSAVRSAVSGVAAVLRGRRPSARREIDWEKTKAFFSGTVGNIFINLQGREPLGIVELADYDGLCDILARELAALKDPVTGELVVERVERNHETTISQQRSAPDLVLLFRKGYGVVGDEIALHDITDTGEIIADAKNWSGNHEKEGIFIAWGGPFKQGLSLGEAEIIDAAPTILYGMNVPVPRTMDGRVLETIFTDEFQNGRAIRFTDDATSAETGSAQLNDAEKDAIQEQLRNLGYIE